MFIMGKLAWVFDVYVHIKNVAGTNVENQWLPFIKGDEINAAVCYLNSKLVF